MHALPMPLVQEPNHCSNHHYQLYTNTNTIYTNIHILYVEIAWLIRLINQYELNSE